MIYVGMIIYKITNKSNGMVYIGQTIGEFKLRWRDRSHVKGYRFKYMEKKWD